MKIRFLFIAWWLLVGAAWSGCGPSVDLDLPNGYTALVSNSSSSGIQWPDEIEYGSTAVGGWNEWVDGLDVQGDLVIGRLVDSSNRSTSELEWPLLCYFLIDTRTHSLEKYKAEDEWLVAIEAAGGSSKLNLRRITPFFHAEGSIVGFWFLKLIPYVLLSLVVIWVVRRFCRAKRDIESDGIGLI